MQDSGQDYFSTLWHKRVLKLLYFDYLAARTVPNLLFKAKIINIDPFQLKGDLVSELNQQQPPIFNKAYKLSGPVMIRSIG